MATVINPVAQTFFVDAGIYPKGLFVESVDLIFSQKDTETYLPFTVQLRPTVNGYPHSYIIYPFSNVSRGAFTIKTVSGVAPNIPSLDNSDHYTRFTFTAPVFLSPGEHALVLYTYSDNYQVFISEIGGVRLDGSERRVDKQPYAGSFFKSSNGTTYTPYQDIDLVFRLNKCDFTLGSSALRALNIYPTANTEYDLFKVSSTDLIFKNTLITYTYKSTSNTTKTLSGEFEPIIINNDIYLDDREVFLNNANGSFQINAILETADKDVSPVIDAERLNVIGIKYQINDCSFEVDDFTIVDGGSGYTSNVAITVTADQGSGAAIVGVANVISGKIESIVVTDGGSGYVGGVTATAAAPPVPSGNTTAVIAVESETNSSGGPAHSRYITRRVVLQDGFDANMIRVYLTSYKPAEAEIEVYYKVLSGEDNTNFDNRPYVRMQRVQPGNENLADTRNSQTFDDFLEQLYIPTTEDTSYIGSNSITYGNFKTFAIKIVLRTSNPAYSPVIRDFRALALAP